MKINKKLFILSSLLVVGLTGCNGNKNPSKWTWNVDGPNKTKIIVGNFGGGIGSIWLEEAAERFAEKVFEKSYAEGKQGVYISHSDSFNLNTSTMGSSATSIFFDERFSDITQLAQQGLLLNLDSLVRNENRTGGSLDSLIFENAKDGLQLNNEYYGLPHYEYYGGFSYNRDIFNDALAYFAAPEVGSPWETDYGTFNFIDSLDDEKSAGPDGKTGTSDDGLPSSLTELLVLCDFLKTSASIPPFVISGQHHEYSDYIVSGLWTSLAGTEQMKNYFNCSGEIEVVKKDGEGNFLFTDEEAIPGTGIKVPETETITLTKANGYRGNDMVAKYYAIAVGEVLTRKGYYNTDSDISTKSHYDAQRSFLFNGKSSAYDKAAMLIDGTYWYNESEEQNVFDQYEKLTGKKKENVDVKWLPLPTVVNDEEVKENTPCLVDMGASYAMVNANISNNNELKTACLEFIDFLYSQEELINFSVSTGMSRMIKYNLTDTQKSNSGKFYENLFNIRDSEGSNVVALSSTLPTTDFLKVKSLLAIQIGSKNLRGSTSQDFKTMLSKNNAKEIFASYSYDATAWPLSSD